MPGKKATAFFALITNYFKGVRLMTKMIDDKMDKMINSYNDFKTALFDLKQHGYNSGDYSDSLFGLFEVLILFGADKAFNQALVECGRVDDYLARHPLSTLDDLKDDLKTINLMIDSLYACILADQQDIIDFKQ